MLAQALYALGVRRVSVRMCNRGMLPTVMSVLHIQDKNCLITMYVLITFSVCSVHVKGIGVLLTQEIIGIVYA
jgi:hypothetical protein